MSLGGFSSASDFSGAHATSFIRVMATLYLHEPQSSVGVNMSGLTFTAAGSRRAMLATSALAVPFSVVAANGSHAASLTSGVAGMDPVAFATDFNADLNASGVSGPPLSVVGAFGVTSVLLAPSPPVNLTTAGANTSAAVAQVSALLANTTGLILAGLQASILAGLDSSLTGAGGNATVLLSPAAAYAVSTLVLAVIGVSPNASSLAPGVQASALAVLASVAANAGSSGVAAADATLSALSFFSTAGSTSVLATVANVVDSLLNTTAQGLLANGNVGANQTVSLVLSSPAIQALVQVSPSAALFSESLTAPGAPSSFDPMPSDLFSSSMALASVVTQFRALAFDPHANGTAAGNISTVGGVTKLAFSTTAGAELVVANLSAPITFTLPAVPTAGGVNQSVCAFYDAVAGAYSTAGCIGVPNPGPPGHTLAFVPGYQTPSDASLALAWNITGPLLAGCNTTLIDCSLPNPPVIFPDPRQPLAIPAVSCPVNATKPPVLRVFYGTSCALWQPGNAYGCSWNNTLQAFNGTGCVATGNVTRCMCRHLTDFAAARTPKLTTCSLSDMLSLNPADIVTKLRMLFIVVIVLFGVMNAGAVVGYVLDARERQRLVYQLQRPETEFAELPGGVWTWTLKQLPLSSTVEAPTGSAPALAFLMGIPLVRLRAALPDELFTGVSVGEALGLSDGLSLDFMTRTRDEQERVHRLSFRRTSTSVHSPSASGQFVPAQGGIAPRISSTLSTVIRLSQPEYIMSPPDAVASSRISLTGAAQHNGATAAAEGGSTGDACTRPGRIPTTRLASIDSELALVVPLGWKLQGAASSVAPTATAAQHNGAKAAAEEDMAFKASRLAGTALVLAFMSVNNVCPVAELTHRKAAAAKFFHGVRMPGVHRDFETLLRLFMGMLIEGNLGQRKRWLDKAHLWRMVLLQCEDGSWSLSQSLAVAVEAHAPCEAIRQAAGTEKPSALAGLLALCAVSAHGPSADFWDALDDMMHHGDDDLGLDDDDGAAARAAKEPPSDDPMAFSRGAMVARMPPALRQLALEHVPASRVWATLLAMCTLEQSEYGWLATEDEDPVERTVVDAADAYLRAQAKQHPALGALLRSGELHAQARRARRDWQRLMEAKVMAVRKAELTIWMRPTVYAQRFSTRVALSMMTDNSQFSTFLDESAAVMRWQRWMILMTLVCGALLVSIWFYQSRGAQCCAEIRAILGCESAVSCLSFTGSCADLPAQFATLQGPFVYGTPPSEHADLSEYECHAFPDDAYPIDQLLVGLISIAVAIPTGMFLGRCFELANEGEDWPDAWLELPRGWVKMAAALLFGEHFNGRWHYTTAVEGDEDRAAALKRRSLSRAARSFGARSFGAGDLDDTVDGGLVGAVRRSISTILQKTRGQHSATVPPCRRPLVLWYVRHSYEMPTMWLMRFTAWSWGLLRGAGRTGAGDAHTNGSTFEFRDKLRDFEGSCDGNGHDKPDESAASEAESDGAADARNKRLYAAAGLLGIYLTWAIFSWCAVFTRHTTCVSQHADRLAAPPRFIFTYGMLIYRQLGDSAQKQFAKSWCV